MSKGSLYKIGLTFGLLIILGLGLIYGRNDEDSSDAFSWDSVSRGDIRETISASGEIRAKVQVNIGTSVAGEIKAIHVMDGQDVAKGELLVTIDQERLRQNLLQARGVLEGARQDAARQKAVMRRSLDSFARYEILRREGLVSEEDFQQQLLSRESALLSYRSAEANVVQCQANLKAVEDALSKASLRAPFSGRVTGLKAEVGETAIPGISNLPGATLMALSDMSIILAEVRVNESEVVRLRKGLAAQVTVESLPGKVFHGTVSEVATGTDSTGADASLYRVKIALQGAPQDLGRLRPGMSARAVIVTQEVKGAMRVALQAVLEREITQEEAQKQGLLAPASRNVVMVCKGIKAEERNVQVGIANSQFFQLLGGLSEGERVLTGPIRNLKALEPGASINLRKRSDSDPKTNKGVPR